MSTYSGFYDSRVMDAGGTVAWSTLGWTPQHPTLKELPNGGATEVAYSTGNIDMTGNVLLTHFDESAWTGVLSEVVDSSGAANHGRAFGTATTTLAGKFNRAGDFNGSSKYVRFLNSPGLTNTATVSMWLKARTTQTAALNYPIGIGTTNSFSIFVGGTYADASVRSRSIGLFAGGNVSCAVANSFTHANDSNVWRHIVVTYDKDAATRTHIYKDGVELTMFSQNVTGVIAAQDIIHIGIRPDLLLPFDGLIDEVAIWTRTLSPAEVYNLYRRGSVRLKFQVRTCATAACTGQSFVGPGGIIGTFFSELTSPTLGLPTALNISAAVANNQYFQYRAYMETDVSTDTPSLKNIAVGPSYYDSGNPTVVNNTPISYTSLSQFTETLGAGNVGTVKFQISKDGTNWYYHNGVTWSAASGFAQANTAAQIDTNIAIFSSVVGPGNFYFKAFLNSSSGTQAVELDNVSIQGIR